MRANDDQFKLDNVLQEWLVHYSSYQCEAGYVALEEIQEDAKDSVHRPPESQVCGVREAVVQGSLAVNDRLPLAHFNRR